jgi:hypothetical protein
MVSWCKKDLNNSDVIAFLLSKRQFCILLYYKTYTIRKTIKISTNVFNATKL